MTVDDNSLLPAHLFTEEQPASAQSSSNLRTEFRAFSDSSFSSGWYMLEVRGTLQTIGSNVSVRGLLPDRYEEVWYDIAQVQVSSHQDTKRVVRISDDVEEVCILVDDKVEFETAPSITLIRVTAAFASDRMQKKMQFGSSLGRQEFSSLKPGEITSDDEMLSFYQVYQRFMERHNNPVDYSEWLAGRDSSRTKQEPSASSPTTSIVQSHGREIMEFESTVQISITDTDNTNAVDKALGGKTSGLLANPSLSVFLTDFNSHRMRIEGLLASLKYFVDNIQCQLKVVIPTVARDQSFQEIANTNPSLVEIIYFDLSADCTAIDSYFTEQMSDLQVFVSGNTILQQDCLLQLYNAIRTNPGATMIYSDSDCIDEFGRRVNPVFKPEWNPELLLNGNYIGSVVLIARHILIAAGGWRHRFEDSSLYDLLLRAGDLFVPDAVIRIPDILWHTSIEDSLQTACLLSGRRAPEALFEYFESKRETLNLEMGNYSRVYNIGKGQLNNSLKVHRQFEGLVPMVEILIPSKDKVDLLESCINSILRKTTYVNYRITIIDNGSEQEATLEYFAELENHPVIKLLRQPGEFNYSALNNFAVAQSDAEVVVLLNNDTEVIAGDWLSEMVAHAVQPEVGCVGAKLYYSNNRLQHGGVIVGLKGMAGHAHRFLLRDADGYCGRLKLSQNVTAVTAACLAVRREVYEQVGGLNETDLKVAYNDVDFCLRVLQAGYYNLWTPYAELYHHESISRGSDDTPIKRQRFKDEFEYMRNRWSTDTWVDSAYNPNLAKDLEDFSLSV